MGQSALLLWMTWTAALVAVLLVAWLLVSLLAPDTGLVGTIVLISATVGLPAWTLV